jgi:hypothetical protein
MEPVGGLSSTSLIHDPRDKQVYQRNPVPTVLSHNINKHRHGGVLQSASNNSELNVYSGLDLP